MLNKDDGTITFILQMAVAPTNKVNQIEKIRVNLISEIKRSLFLNIKLN